MRRKISAGLALVATVWLGATAFALLRPARVAADNRHWGAGYFPNVTLTTQDGVPVRFYDDLVKGKIVAISLIYTTCKYACPLETARMAQVAKLLGDRMGRDVFFYSITIDPEHDTPQVLKEYAEKFHAGPGWTFLTGKDKDIELISRKLGLYSEPNPGNPDGHTPMLIIGNEATGQWMRNSATDNAKFLARTIGDWLNSWQTARKSAASYADMPNLTFDPAEVSFRNHCAACHTIGRGDLVGPDLQGVVARRTRDWLARFIAAPDRVLAAGDPIARDLVVRYRQALMPNLGLGSGDAEMLIDYIDARSRAGEHKAASVPAAADAAGSHASLAAIVDPYVRIQQALSDDRLAGIDEAAATLTAAAATMGAGAAPIRLAATAMRRPSALTTARGDFGRLGDAILIYAKAAGSPLGDRVTIAYCPMAHRYWLQRGETLQNPFFGKRMAACGRIAPNIPRLAN